MTPEAGAARVLHHALRGRPRLGHARLVCIDGPSGSGKSTLADAVRAVLPSTQVVPVDNLLGGWDGLPRLGRTLDDLLGSIAAGRDGWWRQTHWISRRPPEWHRLRPGGLIVLEGVGAASGRWSSDVSAVVWVEAPRDLRRARGLARGDGMAEHGRRWRLAEDAHFARLRTRERADVILRT